MLIKFPTVNVLKGNLWNSESEFDQEKDKTQFRDYDAACDRVKNFYREQHGLYYSSVFSFWHVLILPRTQRNKQ